jgi:iron complex outermembrane receptor protein
VAFGAPAYADAQATSAASAAPSADVGDIIVTARRKNESLQSVPISITALSQNDLVEHSVTSATDLAKVATGLTVTADSANPTSITFSIRGRGQVYGAATGSVETYFGDIPLSSTFQMPAPPPQFFDLNTFQVLKGPQGTLFGRNTTGGAVVILPQAPKLGVTEGYVRVQGGTYNDFQIEAAINIPLGDKAALRLAAFDWQRKGYENSSATDVLTGKTQVDAPTGLPIGSQNFNNVDTTQLRASLYLAPSDGIENTTVASYIVDKTRSSPSASLWQGARVAPTAANPFGVTVMAAPSCGNYCAYINVNLTKPASKYYIVENTTKLDITDGLKLKNIIGYINSSAYGNVATDSTASSQTFALIDLPVSPRAQTNQQFTEELQLQGNTADNKLTYTIGGMYDKTAQPTGINDINVYSLSYSGAASNDLTAINFQSTNVLSKALYASATYAVVTGLNITGGYRKTWIDVAQSEGFSGEQIGSPAPLAPGALVCNTVAAYPSPCNFVGYNPAFAGIPASGPNPAIAGYLNAAGSPITTNTASFSGSTYNLGADYHVSNAVMVYGGYRHGWKRGGFNPSSQNGAVFSPETVDDFTVGVKSKFKVAEVPVRFNLELFYDKYTGLQTSYLALGGNQLITNTININKSRYQGFDADISLQPANWLDLSASWSFNDAKILKWPDLSNTALGAADLTQNPLPYVVKNKFSITPRLHTEAPGSVGEFVLMGTVNYQTKYYDNAFAVNSPIATQYSFYFNNAASYCAGGLCGNTIPGYTTVDARIELNHAFGSRFDLAAAVTNLTNKYYLLGSSGTIEFGAEGYAVAAPRMFTFEVRTKF